MPVILSSTVLSLIVVVAITPNSQPYRLSIDKIHVELRSVLCAMAFVYLKMAP